MNGGGGRRREGKEKERKTVVELLDSQLGLFCHFNSQRVYGAKVGVEIEIAFHNKYR